MANPQDNKRPGQSDKSKSGQQSDQGSRQGDQGSRPEPRQGQGGRPGEGQEYPKSGEKKRPEVSDDEESGEESGNK